MTAGNTALFVLVFSVVVLGQQTELVRPKTDNHLSGTQPSRQEGDAIKSRKAKEQMIRAMESTLLKMFGLTSRPKPSKGIHIPDYMWKLYSDNVRKSTDAGNFLPEGIRITHTANTIRSFHHTDAEDEEELYPHPNHVRLVFNLSSIPQHEVLTDVQLRLYRKQVLFHSLNQDHLKTHRIDIYEIIRPASQRSEAITRLLDTKLVHPRNTSWESFDIHPAVLKWRERPHLNYGLEVHFVTKNGQSSSVSNHVRLRRSTRTKDRTWSGQQPLLVTYSDDRKKTKARTRRSHHRGRHSRSNYKRKHNICKRHPLYVDFTDVGWNEWIVAPPGYQAFYCHGECPTVLPDYLNTTNHAIVQNLVNDVNPRSVPKACCIPTELSSINMLYLDESDKVVLKNYDDMVVDACGCR